MADYSQSFQRVQDLEPRRQLLPLRHVGTFDVYKRNSYGYDPAGARFVHNGWEDTLVTFTPSPHNPELAASTTSTSASSTTSRTTRQKMDRMRAC